MFNLNNLNKIELSQKLADTYEWHEDFHFTESRKFRYDEKSDVIVVTKGSSIFGFSISINQNKKLNLPFAYINLIKLNNLDNISSFEKVTSLGKPVNLSNGNILTNIIKELEKIIEMF